MENIHVVGVGMTPFGCHLDITMEELCRRAMDEALVDAGTDRSTIQAAIYSGITQGFLHGQTMVPGQIYLQKAGLDGIPVFNVENACASGSSAFHLAVQMVKAGSYDIALAIGTEKMNIADKKKMFAVFDGAWDVRDPNSNVERLLAPVAGFEAPEGSESKRPYSVFMKVYAAFCKSHMERFGTTQRQIAAVCAKNHQHSVHNPRSQFRDPYSIEEVLAAPPITYPLTLPMCSPISDGSAAVVICNKQGLGRLGAAKNRAVKVLASVARSSTDRDIADIENNASHLAAKAAYEMAGLGPDDMNLAEVHDATAMGEILQIEYLGFTEFGAAGPAAERGEFSIGGRLPINTSGGLESKGHPIGATGLGQIYELVTQLRGEAGVRQVEGAHHAIQENGGGLVGIEEGAAVINIFSR